MQEWKEASTVWQKKECHRCQLGSCMWQGMGAESCKTACCLSPPTCYTLHSSSCLVVRGCVSKREGFAENCRRSQEMARACVRRERPQWRWRTVVKFIEACCLWWAHRSNDRSEKWLFIIIPSSLNFLSTNTVCCPFLLGMVAQERWSSRVSSHKEWL